MSFDPTKPVNSSKIVAAELRGQFNSLKALIDAVPSGALLERHEYEFYGENIPAASGTIGHVTGSHGMMKIADGITCWRDLPYVRQVAPGGYPSAYVVTGCGDASYNGIYQYRGIEPDGGTPYPSYELSAHRVLVYKSSMMAADGWQIGQHNDGAPRYFVSSGGDPSDPTAGVWSDDGVLGPFGLIRSAIGTAALSGILYSDGASGIRAAIPGTDYVATLAGVAVSSFANDAGYYIGDGSAFATAAQGTVAATALQPNASADGTYPVANDGATSGQVTGFTIANGLIIGVTVVP